MASLLSDCKSMSCIQRRRPSPGPQKAQPKSKIKPLSSLTFSPRHNNLLFTINTSKFSLPSPLPPPLPISSLPAAIIGCKQCCKTCCTLFCEDRETLDDAPLPAHYPRPGRHPLTRARVPQEVITQTSTSQLRPVPLAGLSPSPTHTPSPHLRLASLFAGQGELRLCPVVGSPPSLSSSSASLSTVVEESNIVVDDLPVASFRRWSWPLTSRGEGLVTCEC